MGKEKLIIWGATGQAIVLEEILRPQYDITAIFDRKNILSPIQEVQFICGWDGFENWKRSEEQHNIRFIVAIGGALGKDRMEISEKLIQQQLIPINAIHSTAYVSSSAIIGTGVQIMPMVSVCVKASIGHYTILNTSCSIDHECKIGNGVHIGPGAKLAGCIQVDDFTFIGTGSVILPRIHIGKNSIIGAGSVVTSNIPDNVIAYGNPCRVIKNNN